MDRPSSMTRMLFVPLAVALIATACGGPPEEGLIKNYFRAARMGDNTTLGNIAIVSFSADTDGVVLDLTVTNVQEERRSLRIKELQQANDEVLAAQDEFSTEMKVYQDENIEAIDRVLRAERAEEEVGRRDQEVQEAWRGWRDRMSEHTRNVADARSALGDERGSVELSLMNAQTPVDASQYDGELVTKSVSIDAEVRMPDDEVVEKSMTVMMQRAELHDGEDTIMGRWIITSVEEA